MSSDLPDRPVRDVRTVLTVVFLSLLMLAAMLAMYSVRWLFLTALLGIGLGVLLVPAARFLRFRLKLPLGVVAPLIVISLLGAIGGFAYLLTALLTQGLGANFEKLTGAAESAQAQIAQWLGSEAWVLRRIEQTDLTRLLDQGIRAVMQGLQISVTMMASLILVAALGIYVAADPNRYLRGMLSLFPAHSRARASQVLQEAGAALQEWFAAQLIALLVVGAITTAALWLIGVEQWWMLGIVTAVCELVPYVGPIAAASVSVLATLGTDPSKALWVLAAFTAIQQLEGNFITPMVYKKRIELPPVQLLILLLFMSHWFGILGAFTAAPLLAIGRRLYLRNYIPDMNERKAA